MTRRGDFLQGRLVQGYTGFCTYAQKGAPLAGTRDLCYTQSGGDGGDMPSLETMPYPLSRRFRIG
jgi:hypothetical protein